MAAQNPATKALEQAYWACDQFTASQPFDLQTAMACSMVYEKLKAQRFNGDFCQMLAWWRQHKDAMHGAGDAADAQRLGSRR